MSDYSTVLFCSSVFVLVFLSLRFCHAFCQLFNSRLSSHHISCHQSCRKMAGHIVRWRRRSTAAFLLQSVLFVVIEEISASQCYAVISGWQCRKDKVCSVSQNRRWLNISTSSSTEFTLKAWYKATC